MISNEQGVATILDNDQVLLFSDSFEHGQWNGLWVQDSQNDWFTSTQRATDGSYSAEVDGSASDATLTIASSDQPHAVRQRGAHVSTGSSRAGWTRASTWRSTCSTAPAGRKLPNCSGNVDAENVWHSPVVDIDGSYLVSNFQFRFRAKMSGSDEDANVDNVQLDRHQPGRATEPTAGGRG